MRPSLNFYHAENITSENSSALLGLWRRELTITPPWVRIWGHLVRKTQKQRSTPRASGEEIHQRYHRSTQIFALILVAHPSSRHQTRKHFAWWRRKDQTMWFWECQHDHWRCQEALIRRHRLIHGSLNERKPRPWLIPWCLVRGHFDLWTFNRINSKCRQHLNPWVSFKASWGSYQKNPH